MRWDTRNAVMKDGVSVFKLHMLCTVLRACLKKQNTAYLFCKIFQKSYRPCHAATSCFFVMWSHLLLYQSVKERAEHAACCRQPQSLDSKARQPGRLAQRGPGLLPRKRPLRSLDDEPQGELAAPATKPEEPTPGPSSRKRARKSPGDAAPKVSGNGSGRGRTALHGEILQFVERVSPSPLEQSLVGPSPCHIFMCRRASTDGCDTGGHHSLSYLFDSGANSAGYQSHPPFSFLKQLQFWSVVTCQAFAVLRRCLWL